MEANSSNEYRSHVYSRAQVKGFPDLRIDQDGATLSQLYGGRTWETFRDHGSVNALSAAERMLEAMPDAL